MSIVISEAQKRSNPCLQKIRLVRGNLAEQEVDALVSLIPYTLEHTGAINEALFEAAGPALDDFILEHIVKPKVGDVYAVPGFNLSARHVIYTFRPLWKDDFDREDKHVLAAVRKAMVLSKCMVLGRIAFPPLGAGKKEYGPARSARIVVQGILDRIDESFQEVRIVCDDDETYAAYRERLIKIGWWHNE